ncbi:hypothetical protein V8F20_011295 [Naviculisporaceae sp. PSN 640]
MTSISNLAFFAIIMPWFFAVGATSAYLIGPFAIFTLLTMILILSSLQALSEDDIASPGAEASEVVAGSKADGVISVVDSNDKDIQSPGAEATEATADEAIADSNSDGASSEADSDEFLPLEAMPFVCTRNPPEVIITNEALIQSDLDICIKVKAMKYSKTIQPSTVAHYVVPQLNTIEEEDEDEPCDQEITQLSLLDENRREDNNIFDSPVTVVYCGGASDPHDSDEYISEVESPYQRPSAPTPPESDSDDEEFGMIPFERVRELADDLLPHEFEESGHRSLQPTEAKPRGSPDSEKSDQDNGYEYGYDSDESSAFIWDPEEEEESTAPMKTSRITATPAQVEEFPEDWEVVIELEREGYDRTYVMSNYGKRYWRNGDEFTALTEEELDDFLKWGEEADPTPIFISPTFFNSEEPTEKQEQPTEVSESCEEPSEEGVTAGAHRTVPLSPKPQKGAKLPKLLNLGNLTVIKPFLDAPVTDGEEPIDDGEEPLEESAKSESSDSDDSSTVFGDRDMGYARNWDPLPHTGKFNPMWTMHSSVDRNGHMYLIKQVQDEHDIAMGARCDYKPNTWVTMPTRAAAGQKPTKMRLQTGDWVQVPELTLTTPSGVTEWLDDTRRYHYEYNRLVFGYEIKQLEKMRLRKLRKLRK